MKKLTRVTIEEPRFKLLCPLCQKPMDRNTVDYHQWYCSNLKCEINMIETMTEIIG